jgi:hypothetical protein
MASEYLTLIIPIIWMGIPFGIYGLGLLFYEQLAKSDRLRFGLCGLSVLYSCYSVQHPTAGPLFNYMTGFMSVYHPVRAIELLIVSNPLSMRRLRKVGSLYSWESFPPPNDIRRIVCIIDLLANPRAIGWSHGPVYHRPPASLIINESSAPFARKRVNVWKPSRWSFILTQARRILIAYLWFDIYLVLFAHENGLLVKHTIQSISESLGAHLTMSMSQGIYSWLGRVARIISAQFFLDGSHAFFSLVAIGVISVISNDIAGETWTHPTLFGGFRLSSPNLKGRVCCVRGHGTEANSRLVDFWANWWHDILRRPMWSVAQWLMPSDTSSKAHIWVVFAITAASHGMASFTSSRRVIPATRVFIAYCFQPVATIYQKANAQWIVSRGTKNSVAGSFLLWTIEVISSITWLLLILPWQLDDPGQEAFFGAYRLPRTPWSTSLIR